MNDSPLLILAGAEARKRIRAHGFSLDLFDTFIGASGGPKWLTLAGLDRALAQPLAKRHAPLQMIGSSIGALRLACYAQRDPRAAVDRLLESYLDVPRGKIDRPSLRAYIAQSIDAVMEGGAAREIVENRNQPVHLVAVRCSGFAASERTPQLAMVPAGLMNVVNPEWITRAGITRSIFASDLESPIAAHPDYVGDRIALREDNVAPALRASGSIPGFLEGVQEIPGAPEGIYRDGGIIDYHFNPHWHTTDGLILYPHFAPVLVPGWFDRLFPGRHLDPETIDRLVLLTPSPEFVAGLPYSKIPDRRDAIRLSSSELRKTWTTVARETERLGDTLAEWLSSGSGFRL